MGTDLMQKLMISKAIMDKHNEIPRGQSTDSISSSVNVQNFDAPQAKFNIPQEFISENSLSPTRENTKSVGDVSVEAIQKSKLPDAIKKLMLENPIQQPASSSPVLSDELVEKASRLMNKPPKPVQQQTSSIPASLDLSQISTLVKQAVNEALTEKGLIFENEEKSNDIFSFRVGAHVFEGKITKVKKVK